MAYATKNDIKFEFRNFSIGTLTSITESEIEKFIEEEEAVINATISNRYITPVVGVEAVKILKRISIAYVAFRVATIANLKKDVSVLLSVKDKFVPQELNQGSTFKVAKQQLADIQFGRLVLHDAIKISNEQGVKSYNADNNIAPIWERDKKQW